MVEREDRNTMPASAHFRLGNEPQLVWFYCHGCYSFQHDHYFRIGILVTTFSNPRITGMNIRQLEKRGFKPHAVVFDDASLSRDPELFRALSILSSVNRVLLLEDYK
ncbi:hypothetical protein BDV38DRAFT_141021 [Aspergillus pseudotamarii]|uniref:Uncharacterized protein n=1 Tax=Aspergillus pseudotamarii TaxID=132259 RepID=A0A5N6SKY6_ASPPS|nr:uncharacterized protein BDV38DRAFT_141021 [Aspergillus pseudotamarii]KAE8135356.1 hypothetical protein BDV38DRAFT_141021 [Aspergillus pseudotamarii]